MKANGHLPSGALLFRNIVWNALGLGLPLLVALWAIPILIAGMGVERFGLLTIVWSVIGYFSFFDLGIGRALTKLVAESVGKGTRADVASVTSTGLRLLLVLGVLAGAVVAFLASWLVRSVLNTPDELVDEALRSFLALAVALPFVVSSTGLVGILQAHQRFVGISLVRFLLGLLNFLGPVVLMSITPSLALITSLLGLFRVAAWVAYRVLCGELIRRGSTGSLEITVRRLLQFGSWVTVSNVVGPLMVYMDRFVIGGLLSVSVVAYYTTPFEIIVRFFILPEAVFGVLFPALVAAMVVQSDRAKSLIGQSSRLVLIAAFPLASLLLLFASELLQLWLGSEFRKNSADVLRWLCVGLFANCIARLPLSVLHGTERVDVAAKLHLCELPVYLTAVTVATSEYGIVGTAVCWAGRALIDAVALHVLAAKIRRELSAQLLDSLKWTVAMSGALVLLLLCVPQAPTSIVLGIVIATATVLAGLVAVKQMGNRSARGAP